ncbi:MAG: hypothetical protein JWQ10_4153 [Herbaspirillum sp.]|nr:hypothetical protein [Herbaspirillum sp.]
MPTVPVFFCLFHKQKRKKGPSNELRGRKDKGAEVSRSFKKDVFPKIGALAIEAVTREMVAEIR